MQAVARARFKRGSARKMRQVVDLVRGKSVDEALTLLSVLPKGAAVPVKKTVQSAAANALAVEGTAKLKTHDLRIEKIHVDGGPIMKRIRPMGMGRAYRINKRLCHLTVVLEGVHVPEAETAAPRRGRKTDARAQAPKGKAAAKKRAATGATKKPAAKTRSGKKVSGKTGGRRSRAKKES